VVASSNPTPASTKAKLKNLVVALSYNKTSLPLSRALIKERSTRTVPVTRPTGVGSTLELGDLLGIADTLGGLEIVGTMLGVLLGVSLGIADILGAFEIVG